MDNYQNPALFELLTGSYQRLFAAPLVPHGIPRDDAQRWLYEDAPFGVLAHNSEPDPVFIYSNRTAQQAFGYSWDELFGMPSRFSAEPQEREARQRFLESVKRDGYSSGYSGIRIAKSGRRFLIEDATLWELTDARGELQGQAVVISRFRDL